ncbi:MAG: hypothetical protein ACJAYJ_003762 [Saprospiraceae bacterium]|jgi:hypothetical protein
MLPDGGLIILSLLRSIFFRCFSLKNTKNSSVTKAMQQFFEFFRRKNVSATNVHFYSLGAFVYQRDFYPLKPLPRCHRQRARCFLKFENLTIFSLLKLKRTFVYTVINHFFNKWWCTFVTLPKKLRSIMTQGTRIK